MPLACTQIALLAAQAGTWARQLCRGLKCLRVRCSQVALIVPGSHIRVSAFRSAQHHIYVQEVHEITQEEELAADTAALDGSDVKVATLAVSARSAPWQQGDTVTDVPTLFMITGICDKMPVVTVDVSRETHIQQTQTQPPTQPTLWATQGQRASAVSMRCVVYAPACGTVPLCVCV